MIRRRSTVLVGLAWRFYLITSWTLFDHVDSWVLLPGRCSSIPWEVTNHGLTCRWLVENTDNGKEKEDVFKMPPAWELIAPSDDYKVDKNFPLPKEYQTIDLARETRIMNVLTSDISSKDEMKRVLEEIETQPGMVAPGCLLQLAFFYIEAKKDMALGATWLARAYFRTVVDVKMSQDNSLSDLLTNFMLQAGQSIVDAGLSWEDFQEILLKDAMPKVEAWDRATPRGYDRRWASMHSVNTVTEAPMDYLPESDMAKLLEQEYARYRYS